VGPLGWVGNVGAFDWAPTTREASVHRVRVSVLLLALGVVAAACSDVGALEAEIAQQQEEIGTLSMQVADQATAMAATESQLQLLASSVASIDMPQDRSAELAELRDGVLAAISVARAAETSAEDAESAAWDAYDRAEDVASCVNDYMDVIGRWSSNVNSHFNYNYC
jgi:uncharacterized coiled-coil protein SlyX